jgi:UDP-galactopyranose mutase
VNIDTVNAIFDLNISSPKRSSPKEMDEWLESEQVKFDPPKNPEEMEQTHVGKRLYNLIFKPYTLKQWAKTLDQLGPEVTTMIPVAIIGIIHISMMYSKPYPRMGIPKCLIIFLTTL